MGMVGNWMDVPIYAVRYPDSVARGASFHTANGSAIIAGSKINVTKGNIILFSSSAGTTRNSIAEVIYTGTDAAVKDALNKLGVGHNRNQGIPVIRTSSNGTISGAYVSLAPRNTPSAGERYRLSGCYYWASAIVADTAEAEKVVLLPPGEYKLRSKGLKHFKPSMAMSTARI